jgi:hypothetical protein
MFSFGLFADVCSLNANFSERTVCSIFIGESVGEIEKFVGRAPIFSTAVTLSTDSTMKIEQCVPKRHLDYRRRGITQKKAYDI